MMDRYLDRYQIFESHVHCVGWRCIEIVVMGVVKNSRGDGDVERGTGGVSVHGW